MPEDPRGEDEFKRRKQSEPNDKAIGSEEELGDMHFSTENYSVALEYYEKSLKRIHLHPTPADLLRIYCKIAECYIQKGFLREAETFVKSAESHCDETNVIGKGVLARLRGVILRKAGAFERALREATNAYRLLRSSDDHREVAKAQVLIAICYARLGKQDEAEQYFLDALSSCRRIEDTIYESYVLSNLGLFHKNACRFSRAIHYFTRALELCDKLGLTHHRARISLDLGITHLKARSLDQAVNMFKTARGMASSAGSDTLYVMASLMLGVAQTKMGDHVGAEKHLLEGQVLAERRGYGREIALANEYLGDLMAARGDLGDALQNYSAALSRAKRMAGEGDIVAEVLRRETEIFLSQRKLQEAISVGTRALEIARKCGEVHEMGYIERAIGLAYGLLEDDAEAEKRIAASIKMFREANNSYEAYKTCCLFGEHLLSKGGREFLMRARKLINGAILYFEKTEEYRDLAESYFLMARTERELKNRDECLLHLYEAQRLAEDLHDRNLSRRVRRMRRNIENEVAGELAPAAAGAGITGEFSGILAKNPHLMTVLDRLLGDLLGRITFRHGFVSLFSSGNGNRKVTILARRDIPEPAARQLTEWFLGREDADCTVGALLTDVLHDRRVAPIRDILPGSGGPLYFHPLCRDREPFGLLFFQSDADGSMPPRIGQVPDVVASYASFIDFLVQGSVVKVPAGGEDARKRSDDFRHVITRNDRMLRVLNLAERVAQSDATVLLLGETGTGKGLIARAIHSLSPRRDRKFIHVNCAALPETILESELFGHVKGSFTGAICDKKGLLAEADGGTVFLDEIGKTSIVLQGKLLQFLDTRSVRPVGSNEMVPVNVRLIFASKTDLMTMVKSGAMLEDLYYRINDFPITIPPLRERIEDIHLLAEYHLKVFGDQMRKRIRGFTDEALSLMTSYEWPGNVRELEKIVKRAVILTDEDELIVAESVTFDDADSSIVRAQRLGLPERVKDLEKRVISECLIRNGWNRSTAAGELGISYPTLLKKIKDLNIIEGY